MALLPSYTAPPAISWIASYWADDPLTGGGAVGGATQQAIQSTDHNPAHALTVGTNLPQHIRYDPQMNNRGSWLTALNGALYRAVSASEQAATGQSFSVVIVAALPDLSTWAANGTGVGLIATGASVGALGNVGAGYGDGNYYTFSRVGGGNNNYFNRRAITGTPTLLVYRVNAGGGSGPRIRVNGETYGPGPYSDATAVLDYIGLGTGGGLNPYRVGFLGYYKGDITADGNWGAFQDWVQSHYGFDPRATYDSTKPPPISWRAEYLADDFDQASGVWTDRTGRGYNLLSGGTYIKSTGLAVVGTPSATNSAKVNWFAGLHFTGDFEVQAKVLGVLPSNSNIGGCAVGAASQFRWSLGSVSGNLVLTTANGSGYITYTSTSLLPTGYESLWVRATWTKNEGGNAVARFYYGWDGVNWTQLGNAVSFTTFSLPTSANLPCYMGGFDGAVANTISPAVLQKFRLLDGIGGPAILDVDFTANAGSSSFTESSANAQTVNISSGTPLKVNNVLNGKPVVRFDGVDDSLTTVLGSAAVPFSVVCLVKWRTYSGAGQAAVTGTVPATNWYVCNGNNVTSWMFNNSALQYVDTGNKLSTDWHLVRAYFNGASSYLYLDEVAIISAQSTGGSPLATINVGGGAVDIPYLAFYWGDVTTTALWSAWKTWANTYYGLSLP